MFSFLRQIIKLLPSFILAFVLAIAVWILAVTSSDPTEERIYSRPVQVEIVGQDPHLMLTSNINEQIIINLSAPRSIWDRLNNENIPVRAILDLSGLTAGTYVLPIQIQVSVSPVRVTSYTPGNMTLTLENLATRTIPIHLIQSNEPAVGFQAGTPQLNETSVVLSGPESLVGQVKDVRVTLDLNQAHENINRTIPLQAVDANENPVEGVTLNPEQVVVFIPITQRGGYRDVVVKAVLNGQIANGYKLTNISVFPPAVTVFSTNPNLVEQLPGSVETTPLNLNGAKSDLDIHLGLNLPTGVIVVGDQTVEVLVGVAPIEGSLNLSRIKVDISNLSPGLVGKVSPETVDIIISGPLPMLDALTPESVKVFVDLSGQGPGTYQLVPRVDLAVPDIKLESILPGSIEVTISTEPTPSPTPRQGISP